MESLLEKTKHTPKSPEKLASAIRENLCVVIKISASWCGPCKNKHFLESYGKLKENYHQIPNIKFYELDIDKDSHLLDDKDYYDIIIDSVPTFLVSKNGNFTKKFEGIDHIDTINKYLQHAIKHG